MTWVCQIIPGVIAGTITAGLIEFGKFVAAKWIRHKFKCLFGNDLFSSDGLHLVYSQLSLPPVRNDDGSVRTHPYVKPGEESSGIGFSIERPVSSCELRAAKYFAEVMGKDTGRTPLLSSDYELRPRLDISFIAFGGPASNHKTRDAFTNENNDLLIFGEQGIITQQTGRPILTHQPGFDYGLILKIRPRQFPKRTWLICAGIGEWGSSGAAWYLAHKWREIHKFAESGSFAIVIRVRPGQDESTEPVVRITSPAEAERYADRVV